MRTGYNGKFQKTDLPSPSLPTFHKHPEEGGEVKISKESHGQAQGSAAVEEITLKKNETQLRIYSYKRHEEALKAFSQRGLFLFSLPLWGLPYMTSTTFSDFFDPVTNQLTLFLLSAFLGTPSPHPLRTSYMEAPLPPFLPPTASLCLSPPPLVLNIIIELDQLY